MQPRYLFPLITLILFCGLSHLQAQKTWVGSDGGDWDVDANWDPEGVPSNADDVVIDGFTGTITVLNSDKTVLSLSIINSSDVTFVGDGNPRRINLSCTSCESAIEAGSTLTCTATASNRSFVLRLQSSAFLNVYGTLIFGGPDSQNSRLTLGNNNTIATIYGTIQFNEGTADGATNGSNSNNFIMAAGSTFRYAKNGGSMPSGTYHPNSTLEITGMTNNDPNLSPNSTYGNLIWNCPGQTATATLNDNFTFSDVSILDDGNGSLVVRSANQTKTITILGDFTQSANTTIDLNTANNNFGILLFEGTSFNSEGIITETSNNSTGVIEFAGSNPQTASFGTLSNSIDVTVDKPSGDVALASPLTINAGATLSLTEGNLITSDADLLTIAHNASVSPAGGKATSFVDGPVRKAGNAAFTFPTGDGAVWARIGISAPGADTDAFTAQYFHQPFGNNDVDASLDHVSVLEYWNLDRTAGSSSVQVTLHWEDDNVSKITEPAAIRVSRFNGSEWESAGITEFEYTNPDGKTTSEPVSDFSPFTFGSTLAFPENPLPVELLRFTAYPRGQEARLEWATASERNSAFFAVERSPDGASFAEIGRVAAAGNSNALREYAFADERPMAGANYYRLRQVDFDGTFEFSPVRVVDMGRETDNGVSLFPNPAPESFTLYFGDPLPARGAVMLFNNMGLRVAGYELPANATEFTVPVNNLPAGAYIVRITTGRESRALRVVVD